MPRSVLSDEFITRASEPLIELVNDANTEILMLIAKRIKECGEASASDVNRLMQMVRVSDYNKIRAILGELSSKSPQLVEKSFIEVARANERLTLKYYRHRGIEQVPFEEHQVLKSIVAAAIRNQNEYFLNISNTTAFNLDGTVTPIQMAYTKAIDKAVFTVEQGYTDYHTAMRKTVRDLARSGLQSVDYASGRSMNLASAVRMNILDGARQMSLDMREQQAKEYGADAWEISAHGLCRPSHQPYQGRIFSFAEFDAINNGVLASNPIATGECNCHHTKVGVIKAIAGRAYSKSEIADLNKESNKEIQFIGLDGKERKMSKYDATQVQRQQENKLRQLKMQRDTFSQCGDELGAKNLNKEIRKQSAYYRQMSEQAGLRPKMDRTRI